MKDWQSQAHVKWDCKFHVVIVPKYRQKVFLGKLEDTGNTVWTEFLVSRLLREYGGSG